MPLSSGATFAGFRIVRLLSSGGMGEVYLAQHPRLPKQVALKILPTATSPDDEFRERFAREADLAATLYHPHIVGVHDRGESDGQVWIAMDFVDGADAGRLLTNRYPAGMPLDQVVAIVSAVASALDYAHGRGMLHRDVKPANIMLTDDQESEQRVLLADFGIARNLDDISGLTATNMTVGTVAYAAPEQLMGEQVDGRADQYALGATAYHLLTGSQLFPHSNPAVAISRHLNAIPPTLSDHHPVPAYVDDVLQQALAKDPRHRFQSCAVFARALAGGEGGLGPALANATTQAAPRAERSDALGSEAAPQTTGSRRTSVALAACVAIFLLIAGVVALAWRPWDRHQSTAGTIESTDTRKTSNSAPPSAALPAPSPSSATITTTSPSAGATAQELAPFVGRWITHIGLLVIQPSGSGHMSYVDHAACPSCSSADAPTGTVDFKLKSVSGDVASGLVETSSDEQNVVVGADVTALRVAGLPSGQIVQMSVGLFQGLRFCDSIAGATAQCGA